MRKVVYRLKMVADHLIANLCRDHVDGQYLAKSQLSVLTISGL